MTDPALRLIAARAWAVERMPYLGSALYACSPVESEQVPTLAVDQRWRLYWNPEFCAGLSVEQLAGCWLHEVAHLLREHADRFTRLGEPPTRARLFNVAADAVINTDLREGGIALPAGGISLADIRGATGRPTTEEVYRLLLDQAKPQDEADCGSGATPGRRPWEGTGPSTVPGVDDARADLIRRQVAHDTLEHQRDSGDVPGGWRRWATEALEPAVDWRRELNAVVRRRVASIAGLRDYTYSRPSRRRVAGVVLPAMRQPRPPVVYAVVDTSGSMSPEMLARCLAEIDGIVRRARPSGARGPAIRIVACDTTPGAVQAVFRAADVHLTGGGGTDLSPALRTVADLRPPADLIVVLTDGETPWDEHPPAGNPSARYVAVLVNGEVRVPAWIRPIVVT
ncbi:MAG: VWA-like domain-containing protein [Actinoplanes sp.]